MRPVNNRQGVQYMKLNIRRPCDGDYTYGGDGKREYVYCHPSHDHFQIMKFGELEIQITLCGCAWNSGFSRREYIHDFIEEHYGPLILSSKDHRKYADSMLAYTTGSGGQHRHSWDLCTAKDCGRQATLSCYWTNDPVFVIRNEWSPLNSDENTFNSDCIYCSWECYAKTHATPCPVCGEISLRQFSKRWKDKSHELILNACFEGRYVPEIFDKVKATVCSSQCACRHIDSIKEMIRLYDLTREEQRCVSEVRKLVTSAKKSLRNRNLEALSSLQKEFERVATSQE